MKKVILFLSLALFILPSVLAFNLQISKTSNNEVMIADLNQPAVFDLSITNLDASDNLQFYNLVGLDMFPKGTVPIAAGETKNIQLMVYPNSDLNVRGFYTFQYFISSQYGQQLPENLTMNIVDLKDSFNVGSGDISPDSNSVDVYIQNKLNFNFDNVSATFSSPFFNFNQSFSLGPYENKTFSVNLNKADYSKLLAGYYSLNAYINAGGKTVNEQDSINFAEKNIVQSTSNTLGWVINTETISKQNQGNVVASSETVINKNIISRLFTSFSPEPAVVNREGFFVDYTWINNIQPGQTLDIVVKTNWLLPFVIIIFIIVIVILAKQYTKSNLIMKKKVSFVRAKGGEFALKVSIMINARKHMRNVNIVDRLPHLVKVYEKFLGERPIRVNEKNRSIEWHFDSLLAGQRKILSYIIYSKVGVMGRFALPEAHAIFDINGEIRETSSNKAFFVTEQRSRDAED